MGHFSFGDYSGVCREIAMISCPLLGTQFGIVPDCYSRNIDINNTIIFQPATCLIHFAAILMTVLIIYHVRIKYTAVGRQEILLFFYLYIISEFLAPFLESAVIPTHERVYIWFAASYVGLKCAIFWCLMLNGFVGFQFAEDGTPLSLWILRISTLALWAIGFTVAACTYIGSGSLGPSNDKQGALWFFELVFPLITVLIYVVSQVILIVRTLNDMWHLSDVVFGVLAYISALILMYGFSNDICENVKHYIDGTFFCALCMLFSVMMVYKYWDAITKEDLEFSVGSKMVNWDVKEPFLSDYEPSLSNDAMRSSGSTTRMY